MKPFFVTGTGTNVGKTYTTLMLMEHFAKKGYKVGAFKPIETGVKDIPEDGKQLLAKSKELNREFKNISVEDIAPVRFSLPAAPYVANRGSKINYSQITKSFQKLRKLCDIIFIEGAGGLMVPLELDYFMIDFINYFDAKAILVTHDRLGCINETLLSISLLERKNISFSWCINRHNDEMFDEITLPFYRNYFNRFYQLPYDLESFGNILTT